MNSWEVGTMVPINEAYKRTGKGPLWGKWVNVNKGDEKEPNIRSRYVACEVNTHKDESLFASTPPLEALRLLLSWTASGPQVRKRQEEDPQDRCEESAPPCTCRDGRICAAPPGSQIPAPRYVLDAEKVFVRHPRRTRSLGGPVH